MNDHYRELRDLTDARLQDLFAEDEPFARLNEAMRYSLLAGGKRLRPVLAMAFCEVCGAPAETALDPACALELLHTYSLIHDDLPCMDDDELRRGKPTNHIVFGEGTAVLAGDCLQAEAFGTILRSALPADRRAECARILADAVGLDGMCGGQFLDMQWEGKTLSEQELTEINSRKTGALIIAACQMGVAAAGGDEAMLESAAQFGAALGMAFQIRDDVLDVISTAEKLGKPIGSDAQECKNTYMALMGPDGCERTIARLTQHAKDVLSASFDDTEFLFAMADALSTREQ